MHRISSNFPSVCDTFVYNTYVHDTFCTVLRIIKDAEIFPASPFFKKATNQNDQYIYYYISACMSLSVTVILILKRIYVKIFLLA